MNAAEQFNEHLGNLSKSSAPIAVVEQGEHLLT